MRAFKLVLVAGLIFAAPTLALAQDTPDPKPADPKPADPKTPPKNGRGGRSGSIADRLKEALGLTDDQVTKIKGIEADIKAEADKADKDKPKPTDRAATRTRMKEIRDKVEKKVRDILTDDQKKKFDDFLKKQEEDRKKREEQRKQGGKNVTPPM